MIAASALSVRGDLNQLRIGDLQRRDAAGVDDTVEHVAEQFGDVDPGRGRTAPPAGVGEERLGEWQLAMRDADDADGGAGPGDGERGRNGLRGADALERRVGADAAGELEHSLDRLLAARLDDVGGAELTGDLLPPSVTTERDSALPPAGQVMVDPFRQLGQDMSL